MQVLGHRLNYRLAQKLHGLMYSMVDELKLK